MNDLSPFSLKSQVLHWIENVIFDLLHLRQSQSYQNKSVSSALSIKYLKEWGSYSFILLKGGLLRFVESII